jgi:hypothetical protein
VEDFEMVALQTIRLVNMLPAVSATAAFTTTAADSVSSGIKSDYATIIVNLGAMASALTVLKLTDSDDNTTYGDVTGFVGGTDFTLPTATDDNKFVVFQVDMKKRKRYLKVEATAGGTAVVMSITCAYSRGKVGPNSAADAGALALVIG